MLNFITNGMESAVPALLICVLLSLLSGLVIAALCPPALYRPACEAEMES